MICSPKRSTLIDRIHLLSTDLKRILHKSNSAPDAERLFLYKQKPAGFSH